ncbi:hypothetical protein DICSQDRAFT_123697 [Dichomitus squalens LYAD-421 SS1]|uniref:uncharacterized protein n=1 Tax=Dichomitus squalens (strain LYAD-421) TaxID=732165 RepID=UPI00044127B6|nr:uncharacterized protein DICSQDRAFT_123697 [Dichomitus squalens LYAD-421 SS1]EJF67314.1 hypothetical protein DICSQDRAFT_123697 [Dichomitus squalens LYAD-421 SS1]
MGELSLRHIPDLSDASGIGEFSDSSFQIPAAARHADDLLLADDTMDFFSNENHTLSTPAPSKPPVQPPLTLAELTPRSKPVRAAATRSSLRPRPGVATPYRANIAQGLSAALSEDLSPFRKHDPSFEIPPPQTHDDDDLLMADDGHQFLSEEQSSLDATPPRAPGSTTGPSTGVTPSDAPPYAVLVEPLPSVQNIPTELVPRSPQSMADVYIVDPASLATVSGIPNMPESIPAVKIEDNPHDPSKKGKGKALSRVNATVRQKMAPGGDKAKRKRVLIIPNRTYGFGGSWIRFLIGSPGSSGSVAATNGHANPHAAPADVKPFRSGGLADTLMSYGQKLMSTTQSSHDALAEHCEDAADTVEDGIPPVPETTVSATSALSPNADDGPVAHDMAHPASEQQHARAVLDRDYLTLSQLSPRKAEAAIASSTTLASLNTNEALVPVLDQPIPPAASSERQESSPSPMRTSIKRAASPADELSVHQRKRGKTVPNDMEPSSGDLRSRRPALQPSRSKNVPAGAPLGSGPTSRTRRVVSGTAKSTTGGVASADRATQPTETTCKPGLKSSRSQTVPGGEGLANPTVQTTARSMASTTLKKSNRNAAPSSSNNGSRSRNFTVPQREGVPDGEERMTDGLESGRLTSASVDRPSTNLPPAKTTKSQEFTFTTSTRMRTRSRTTAEQTDKSTGHSSSGSTSTSTSVNGNSHSQSSLKGSRAPIPDFKSLHAMRESVLARRRAEVHPTVPVGFAFATDTRAAEREKFEEARRARERELERQAEERRRQRELEEEAEIRELRRRAVPRANEVPEWYAFAPKKAKPADAAGGSGS